MGRVAITRSVDEQTKIRLKSLGRITRRGEGYVIDWLVDEAYKRLVSPGESEKYSEGGEDGN